MLAPMEPYRPINIKNVKSPHPCPFNGAVVCGDQEKCASCGWNPVVAEARKLEAIKRIKKKEKLRVTL